MNAPPLNRRELMAGAGAFVLGFWLPPRVAQAQTAAAHGAAWYTEPAVAEINAWIVVEPDDTVVIRIAQTELGQGVWTSNAMIVAEELQCDWRKVRPIYASANRDAREMAPAWTLEVPGAGATDPRGGGEPTFGNRARTGGFGIPDSLYRRMRTNAASSVKDGRYYLQLAGAEARERLMLAAANLWGVSPHELTAKDGVITHAASARTTTYGRVAALAARTPHPDPESIVLKPPEQWTLMGTERLNLDVPMKITGETKYAIDVRLPGMKWAAVKTCPVYGGDVASFDFDAIRSRPGAPCIGCRFPTRCSRAAACSAAESPSSPTRGTRRRRLSMQCRSSGPCRPSVRRSTRPTCARRCSLHSTSPATFG
jgi:isoquinoline 1-oxidoreductase beta subunit